MKAQSKYENLKILGRLIIIDTDDECVIFPNGTTEEEIENISYYLFEEGFLEHK